MHWTPSIIVGFIHINPAFYQPLHLLHVTTAKKSILFSETKQDAVNKTTNSVMTNECYGIPQSPLSQHRSNCYLDRRLFCIDGAYTTA